MLRAFCLICLIFSQSLHASNNITNHILIVGDSLSAAYGIKQDQGWVKLLQNRLSHNNRRYKVVNASISGDTSIGGANRITDLLERYQPRIVIIELGANDGLRGLSLSSMKRNLAFMIERSQAASARVILAGMHIPPNYGPRYTGKFHSIYKELSEQYKTLLIPFLLDGVGDIPGLMQSDGLHPNEQAQAVILDVVWETLEPVL